MPPGAFDHTFIDANDQREVVLAGRVAERLSDRPRHHNALFNQVRKETFDRLIIKHRHIAADIQPRRVARQPCFGKDH